jgi:hypothetical protein
MRFPRRMHVYTHPERAFPERDASAAAPLRYVRVSSGIPSVTA